MKSKSLGAKGNGKDARLIKLKLASVIVEARIEARIWMLYTQTSDFESLASIPASSPMNGSLCTKHIIQGGIKMSAIVDARGLSCPQPVLLTINEIKKVKKGEIIILVDTDTSKENVSRAATSQGWTLKGVEPEGTGYRISISKDLSESYMNKVPV